MEGCQRLGSTHLRLWSNLVVVVVLRFVFVASATSRVITRFEVALTALVCDGNGCDHPSSIVLHEAVSLHMAIEVGHVGHLPKSVPRLTT